MQKTQKKRVVWQTIAVMMFIIVLWIVWTNTHITTTYFTIKNDKIPDDFSDFKIAEIADLHNHPWRDKLIHRLEKEMPDIIVITGDLVDSSHTDIDISMEFIYRAREIAPVYYVTGNHEAWLDNYSELESRLAEAGVHRMDNVSEWIEKGTSKVNLTGIQDPAFEKEVIFGDIQKTGVGDRLTTLLEDGCYNIVLCHRPELFKEYVEAKADLVLTGHAHGGQIRIPFIGGLVAPGQGFFPEYTEGVYHQDKTDMVVSRGLGNSVIPVRIHNMPELVMITLDNKPEKTAE